MSPVPAWFSSWQESLPAPGSVVERWLASIGIDPARLALDELPVRWSPGGAVVALLTDPATARPTGVLSLALLADGRARPPTVMGAPGAIRLSADEDVELGLLLAEDLQTGLALMASGMRPIWAAGSLGVVTGFPVLGGIEALTLFPAPGSRGMAARACAARWRAGGIEVAIADEVRRVA